jgi:hypothetical protein
MFSFSSRLALAASSRFPVTVDAALVPSCALALASTRAAATLESLFVTGEKKEAMDRCPGAGVGGFLAEPMTRVGSFARESTSMTSRETSCGRCRDRDREERDRVRATCVDEPREVDDATSSRRDVSDYLKIRTRQLRARRREKTMGLF